MSTKFLLVEILAHRPRQLVTQAQPLLHHIATQIEVAIFEPDFLARFFVQLKRQRLGAVEHFELARKELHGPGGEIGIRGPVRTRAHQAA